MYPETDVQVIRITKDLLQSIKLPELLDEKTLRIEKQYKLSADLAKEIVREDIVLDQFAEFKHVESSFIANALVNYPKEIQTRHKLETTALTTANMKLILGFLDRKLIAKEAVMDMCVDLCHGKKLDVDKYKAVDISTVEKELREIIKANPSAPTNALMGEAMKKLRGKVDGKTIMDLLKKLTS